MSLKNMRRLLAASHPEALASLEGVVLVPEEEHRGRNESLEERRRKNEPILILDAEDAEGQAPWLEFDWGEKLLGIVSEIDAPGMHALATLLEGWKREALMHKLARRRFKGKTSQDLVEFIVTITPIGATALKRFLDDRKLNGDLDRDFLNTVTDEWWPELDMTSDDQLLAYHLVAP